jgi:Na+-translocating ferredoxin:NAD+ oxidoreductase RnfC subunit
MDAETALRINSAACRIWLWKNGLSRSLPCEDVWLIRGVSVAQMETAAEVVEAVNENAPLNESGTRTMRCTPDAAAMPGIKDYAHTFDR